jgi:hypothetical protein
MFLGKATPGVEEIARGVSHGVRAIAADGTSYET